MALLDILNNAKPIGIHTVPARLLGCWRRNWIRFGADGELENQIRVIWLQTASGMGDVRIDPSQVSLETDSSCGITVVDELTTPYVTADWHDGPSGFAQQAVSNFPEKGWLTWDDPSILRELAPSGAYVEEWERLPGSDGPTAHLVAPAASTTTNLYVAGRYALLCVKSPEPDGLHEFSWAERSSDNNHLIIELSTLPQLVGTTLDIDRQWSIESYCET
ncbi:MAG: hypothetical protein ACKVK3_12565 [Acidimicrobiales bacterium]|jgi:hypothetical protein